MRRKVGKRKDRKVGKEDDVGARRRGRKKKI